MEDFFSALVCSHDCFEHGLIVELAGRHDSVLKLMPALTIEDHVLMEGLNIIKESVAQSVKKMF